MLLFFRIDLRRAIRDVVEANPAENVAARLRRRDILRLAPEDDPKLGFPIQLDARIGPRWIGSNGPVRDETDLRKTSGSLGVGTLISWMCFL